MSTTNIIQNMVKFNTWAVTKYINWLRELPASATESKEVLSSFSSISATVYHIAVAHHFWNNFIAEREIGKIAWNADNAEISSGLEYWQKMVLELEEIVLGFTEEDLNKTLRLDQPWLSGEVSRYNCIIHSIQHSVFHRGQIVTMARSLGITSVPNTDYNFFNLQP